MWRWAPKRAMTSSFTWFLDHTQRRTTVGRTSLDEWWARRRDLYLTTHNTHKRQTRMPPAGFEPAIPASECPQTYAVAPRGRWDRPWNNYLVVSVRLCCFVLSHFLLLSTHETFGRFGMKSAEANWICCVYPVSF